MIGLRDAASFQTKLIEFQAKIIEANNSAFAAHVAEIVAGHYKGRDGRAPQRI
jgi:hypothetical protein